MRFWIAVALLVACSFPLAGCHLDGRVIDRLPSPVFARQDQPGPVEVPALRPVSHRVEPERVAPRKPSVPYESGWRPQARARQWKWIIIHHSATRNGNATKFDTFHRNVRHWENGLGYHFVIGNGTDSGDGVVEVGQRWTRQLQGAHCKTDDNSYNDFGIGVCLVGDFQKSRATAAQRVALAKLVRYLAWYYSIPPGRILGHDEAVATRPREKRSTHCPGRYFDMAAFRRNIRNSLPSR
jgi:N-acetyl-anhydromuramyl-L-alanine amidase AmpD